MAKRGEYIIFIKYKVDAYSVIRENFPHWTTTEPSNRDWNFSCLKDWNTRLHQLVLPLHPPPPPPSSDWNMSNVRSSWNNKIEFPTRCTHPLTYLTVVFFIVHNLLDTHNTDNEEEGKGRRERVVQHRTQKEAKCNLSFKLLERGPNERLYLQQLCARQGIRKKRDCVILVVTIDPSEFGVG